MLELDIERVLTSGHAEPAEAGIPTLQALVTQGAGRLTILAGGGIRASNARRIVAQSGVSEIHLRAGPHGEWVREVVNSVNSQQ